MNSLLTKYKICVVTGSRAEYGLLKNLLKEIMGSKKIKLQLIVTGSHLSRKFGYTFKEIIDDGFNIDLRVPILNGKDNKNGISKTMSKAIVNFTKAYEKLKPDLILVLGDRYEILSVVTSALICKIPVAHLHGGELTFGAFDDSIRHAITKMSHLHFVANQQYRNRVIQLGENPKHVYTVGGLGVDNINEVQLLSKSEIESRLNIKFDKKNLLVTFHPITLDLTPSEIQLQELLIALNKLSDTTLIFTMPNADPGNYQIRKLIQKFVNGKSNSYLFESLGQTMYFSCVKQVDGVIGNSSSGVAEIPSFKKPTINIGDRQKGRLQAKSIINCRAESDDILKAIQKMYSKKFTKRVLDTVSPYGLPGASKKILKVLENVDFENLLQKKFYDVKK